MGFPRGINGETKKNTTLIPLFKAPKIHQPEVVFLW